MKLEHYSNRDNLHETGIDPSKHGTGVPGGESKRKMMPHWVDRSYHYIAGTKPEASLGSRPHVYTSDVPDEAIYDYAKDPDNISAKAKWGQSLDHNLYEKKIKDAGYAGYINHSADGMDHAVALFHPVKPTKNPPKPDDMEKASDPWFNKKHVSRGLKGVQRRKAMETQVSQMPLKKGDSLYHLLRKSMEILKKDDGADDYRTRYKLMPFSEMIREYHHRQNMATGIDSVYQSVRDGRFVEALRTAEDLNMPEKFRDELYDWGAKVGEGNTPPGDIAGNRLFSEWSEKLNFDGGLDYVMKDAITNRLAFMENKGSSPTPEDMMYIAKNIKEPRIKSYMMDSPHLDSKAAEYLLKTPGISGPGNTKALMSRLDANGLDNVIDMAMTEDNSLRRDNLLQGLMYNKNLATNHIEKMLNSPDLDHTEKQTLLRRDTVPVEYKINHGDPSLLSQVLQEADLVGDKNAKIRQMFEPHHLAKIIAMPQSPYAGQGIDIALAALSPEDTEMVLSHAIDQDPATGNPEDPLQQEWDQLHDKTDHLISAKSENIIDNITMHSENMSPDFMDDLWENNPQLRYNLTKQQNVKPEQIKKWWDGLQDERDQHQTMGAVGDLEYGEPGRERLPPEPPPEIVGLERSLAVNPKTPHDVLDSALKNGHFASVALNPNATEDHLRTIVEKGDRHAGKLATDHEESHDGLLNKYLDRHPPENEMETKVGSHKTRQLRDFIEEKGGSIHKKEAEKAGFNLKSMGVDSKVDAKGQLTADAVQSHIDESPGMRFVHSASTYGETIEGSSDDWDDWDHDARDFAYDQQWEHAMDYNPFSDYLEHNKSDIHSTIDSSKEIGTDYREFYRKQLGEGTDDETLDMEMEDSPSLYVEEFMSEALNASRDDGFSQNTLDLAEELRDSHEEAVSESIDIGSPSDYDLSNFQQTGNVYSDDRSDYADEMDSSNQKHSTEQSQVFQLNLHPRTIAEMKKEGVYDTFQNMYNESHMSGHPVGENGIGWVRYTEGDDGVHIDEIQSDFGQSFMRHIKNLRHMAATGGDPRHAEYAKKFPEEEVKKVNDIVFSNHHPSQILHDSFLQHLRDNSKHDKPVHIWHSTSKAPISGQDVPHTLLNNDEGVTVPVSLAHYSQLRPEHKQKILEDSVLYGMNNRYAYERLKDNNLYDPDTGEHSMTIDNHEEWLPHTTEYDPEDGHTHMYIDKKTKTPIKTNDGDYMFAKPLPVHMQQTYDQQPKKMGYKPGTYGRLETQHNPILQEKMADTWKDKVRKTDEPRYKKPVLKRKGK